MRIVVATEDFEAVAFDVQVSALHTARSLERHTLIPRPLADLLSPSVFRRRCD